MVNGLHYQSCHATFFIGILKPNEETILRDSGELTEDSKTEDLKENMVIEGASIWKVDDNYKDYFEFKRY